MLEIPALKTAKVAVFTNEPDTLRPALRAHPQIEATYYTTAQYRPDIPAAVVILDRFSPPVAPKNPSIWLEPPAPVSIPGAYESDGCQDRPLAGRS